MVDDRVGAQPFSTIRTSKMFVAGVSAVGALSLILIHVPLHWRKV